MIDVEATLEALSLDDRCQLLAGATNWRTHEFEHAGMPAIKMSDGPTGIRGEGHGSNGTPGVAVPAGITLGATWDAELLAQVGDLLGKEAVRKRAHVLLGPTVNLHRTPLGGRTFECYSEDPELSGVLAASYVRAVQAHDVAVTVKHFVCNDTEIERLRVDVDVDERTLRELYLRPFELAVRDGGAWGIMSSYNQIAGQHTAQSRWLLTDILRDEWGFEGFVVSDWFGVHETVSAANAGLSIEMPGPARVYGDRLRAAVASAEVSEETIEALTRGVVELAARTRADERPAGKPEESIDDPDERALTRRAAIAGTVLLRNDRVDDFDAPVLPLDAPALGSVAVVGPNAIIDRSMGGGSASLTPFGHRTLLDALTDRLADEGGATVTYEPGVRIDRMAPIARRSHLRTPDGEHGLAVEYSNGSDWDAPSVLDDVIGTSQLLFFGSTPEGVDAKAFTARVTGSYVPDVDGSHDVSMVAAGGVNMTITTHDDDGRPTTHVVMDDPDATSPRTREYFGYGSAEHVVTVDAVAGRPIEVDIHWRSIQSMGFAAMRMGVRPPDPTDLLDRAVAAAADADAAVVVVGTNDEWETEGFDREVMNLPGDQDELVRRVVAANPNTVVVVNAGSPVTMDWADGDVPREHGSAPAIVTSFFAGQEQAEAMVDVLLGVSDPGGRLPLTYPKRLADTPAFLHHEPEYDGDGNPSQRYGEGRFVGHRWYAARGIEPRFWFGHGESYGDTTWGDVAVSSTSFAAESLDATPVSVTVPLSNGHERDATVVVQAYVTEQLAGPSPRRLAAWAKLVVPAGGSDVASLELGPEAFRSWDPASRSWQIRPGRYTVDVGRSADPAAAHTSFDLDIS